YIKFLHPELMVDFLTVGRGSLKERPLKVEKLGIHTQSLQLLDILTVDTAQVKYKSTKITIPNPIRFALHKILISTRRPTPEKKEKDLRQGLDLLEICRRNEKYRDQIKLTFERLHKNRQRKISKIVTI
ncbi:MAG: hypothetical protein KDD52_09975, partial [Bdellovibrionales bacterium]|nr:hypothetical protein [Bdellovibrionales bacterium]